MSAVKIAILSIVVVFVFAGLTVGVWAVGWWFRTQNTNRASHLYQHQYGRQIALRTEISNKLGTIADLTVEIGAASITPEQAQQLKAQRLAVARIVCADADQVDKVDSLPLDQQAWVSENCTYGDVKTTSTLRM